jgi:CheY-like chemotaxis protein
VSHEAHPLSPLLLLAVDVGVGGTASHIAHAIAGLPPSAVGAASALLVGVTLRFAGPTVDHVGNRAAGWLTGAHRIPKGLARCVLIVEDHASGEVLAALLRSALDVPVYVATSAAAGRGLAMKYRPAAIFCDLALPDEHGDEMLSAIGRPGVVLMSGAAHPADLDAAAKRCHAVAMAKPLVPADVVAEARRMLDAATA